MNFIFVDLYQSFAVRGGVGNLRAVRSSERLKDFFYAFLERSVLDSLKKQQKNRFSFRFEIFCIEYLKSFGCKLIPDRLHFYEAIPLSNSKNCLLEAHLVLGFNRASKDSDTGVIFRIPRGRLKRTNHAISDYLLSKHHDGSQFAKFIFALQRFSEVIQKPLQILYSIDYFIAYFV